MLISNASYTLINLKWDSITLPLKAGTPVDAGGSIANNGRAAGIIPQTIKERPVFDGVLVLIGGDVQLDEVRVSYPDLSDSAIYAMSGINFYDQHHAAVRKPGYTLPAATADAIGGVKMAASVADASGDAPTAEEFNSLLSSLRTAGIIAAAEDD